VPSECVCESEREREREREIYSSVILADTAVTLQVISLMSEAYRRIRARTLVVVISRLDYCNSVLAGVPLATFGPLQRVLNAAAPLLFELAPKDRITHGRFPAASLSTSMLAHPSRPISCAALFTLHTLEDAQLIR